MLSESAREKFTETELLPLARRRGKRGEVVTEAPVEFQESPGCGFVLEVRDWHEADEAPEAGESQAEGARSGPLPRVDVVVEQLCDAEDHWRPLATWSAVSRPGRYAAAAVPLELDYPARSYVTCRVRVRWSVADAPARFGVVAVQQRS